MPRPAERPSRHGGKPSPGASRPRRTAGARVTLHAGREKPLRQRHPWIFSGAVESIGDEVADGDVADVVAADGRFLARGFVNRKSQIVVRVLTFDEGERVDAAFLRGRLRRALELRADAGAARCVNAESDGLPGLVVDRYADVWVVQASTLGMARRLPEIVQALEEVAAPRTVYERSDVEGRDKEGLPGTTGLLAGAEPPDLVEFAERTFDGGELRLLVDVRRGHKTGGYLDQSENRRHVAALSRGGEVLNLFSYTGGFGVHAAAAGAKRVVNVDSSADALALSERIAQRNGLADRVEHLRADAFEALRRLRAEGARFDVVVVDPPKFAHSAGHVERAARAYKDLSMVALQLVRPGGVLATFSCSGAIDASLFQKIVFGASIDAGREAQIVRRLGQAPDHPILLTFPEAEYLKGLLCRVL